MNKPVRSVFTFCAFKGGVGRSMAIWNCAHVLAGFGRNVLVVDFDLESPGLSNLKAVRQAVSILKRDRKVKGGLVELINQFLQDEIEPDNLNPFLIKLRTKSNKNHIKPGSLSILRAGAVEEPSYPKDLHKIFWKSQKLNPLEGSFVKWLRKMFTDNGQFDYVLIDSRTGYADSNRLVTSILTDYVVVFSGLNDQNVIGNANMMKLIYAWQEKKQQNGNPFRFVLLHSPVPEWEEDAKKARNKEIKKLFEEHLGIAPPITLSIPYHPRLALREEIMTLSGLGESHLAKAYYQLTKQLQELAYDSAKDWVTRLNTLVLPTFNPLEDSEWVPAPDIDAVNEILAKLRPLDEKLYLTAAAHVADRVANSPQGTPDVTKLLKNLLEDNPGEQNFVFAKARFERQNNPKLAIETLNKAREKLDKTGVGLNPELISNYLETAIILLENDREAALETLNRALQLTEKTDEGSHKALIYWKIANIHRDWFSLGTAFKYFSDALGCYASSNDHSGRVNITASLAYAQFMAGKYDEMATTIGELEQFSNLNQFRPAKFPVMHYKALLNRDLGDYDAARKQLKSLYGKQVGTQLKEERDFLLADMDRLEGDYEQAAGKFKRLELETENQILERECRIYSEWCQAHVDPEDNLESFRQARDLYGAIAKPFKQFQSDLAYAALLIKRKKTQEAETLLEKTLETCQEKGYQRLQADIHVMLSIIFAYQDDSRAKQEAEKARNYFIRHSIKRYQFQNQLDKIFPKVKSNYSSN